MSTVVAKFLVKVAALDAADDVPPFKNATLMKMPPRDHDRRWFLDTLSFLTVWAFAASGVSGLLPPSPVLDVSAFTLLVTSSGRVVT